MTVADVNAVRRATDEPTDQEYTDGAIQALVDSVGVSGAAARIWSEKAGKYAADVDVSEAGASHKFSDLHKNALQMSKHFQALADEEIASGTAAGRPRVRKIERS